jgi:hypothetical protein
LLSAHFAITLLNSYIFECGAFFFAGGVAYSLSKHRLALPIEVVVILIVTILLALHWVDLGIRQVMILAVRAVIFFCENRQRRHVS